MREKLMRFMYGRNGVDALAKAENILILVLLVISMFARFLPLYFICLILIVHMYFRVFSKNIVRRQEENRRYLNLRYNLVVKKNKFFTHMRQRKDYKFFKCPRCSQKVRVPKGHGRIVVCFPKCREKFIRKS